MSNAKAQGTGAAAVEVEVVNDFVGAVAVECEGLLGRIEEVVRFGAGDVVDGGEEAVDVSKVSRWCLCWGDRVRDGRSSRLSRSQMRIHCRTGSSSLPLLSLIQGPP